jgi:hypothetical protein
MVYRRRAHNLPGIGRAYGIDEYVSFKQLSFLPFPFLLHSTANALPVNENSEGITEVFDMMGVMFVTALEMLHESGLIGPTSPLPDNLGVMTLFFLDFMTNTATDFDIEWDHEIVRAADAYGVVLDPLEQVEGVGQGTLDDLRELCKQSKRGKGFAWKTEVSLFSLRSSTCETHTDFVS